MLSLNPHCSGKNTVVGDVILKTSLQLIRERVVQLYHQVAQMFCYRHSVPAEFISVRETVRLPHEFPCVEAQGVMAFLEFVQLFQDSYRYDYVIFLKVMYGLVVMQDDVRVQNEYLW